MKNNAILNTIGILAIWLASSATLLAADTKGHAVHDYGKSGDDPATEIDEAAILASDNLAENGRYQHSTKFSMTANATPVSIYKYQKGSPSSGYYNFDVARFSSEDRTPVFEIGLEDGTVIETVEIYPERYYPQEALSISNDRRTLTFAMSEHLSYCIININGTLTDSTMAGSPMLAVINDPPETNKPDLDAANVLDFKAFSEAFLKANPILDKIGEICRPTGTVTDTSRNTAEQFTWHYEAGIFVDPKERNVRFPNKRARVKHDMSEAFQAALDKVRNSPELDTIYFPAGTYIWSGLCIRNWNGNGSDGKLNIYLDEDALLVNRIQECKEAMEPAIGIWYSSNITISGRGIIDGNACATLSLDRKDARDTPHQGGAMVVQSKDITFNDTYVRDVKQWNWECHTAKNVTYNNIKGLSPFAHAWVDGLDLTSGKNITVNGAFTLGNDDTFASGHYNPSDEFPRRFLDELDRATGEEKARLEAIRSEICAAAAVYNKDRLNWDTDDSENITINDTLGWSGFANNVRFGANTHWKGEPGQYTSYKLKSYTFNNFNSAMRRCKDAIKVHNGSHESYPAYETLIFRNCSFAGTQDSNVLIPAGTNTKNFNINTVIIENCWFEDTSRAFTFRNIRNLSIKNIYIGGSLLTEPALLTLDAVENLNFTASPNLTPAAFVHPGILHSRADLQRMHNEVQAEHEPWLGGFEVFKADPCSQLDYRMRGPGEEIGRAPSINSSQFDQDANAAYQLALMWSITQNKAYAQKSIEIINAWSRMLKQVSGRDAVLMAGLGPFKMINAAEILRHTDADWADADIQQTERMFLEAIYPTVKDFASFANGNWEIAALQTVMAIGVFCNDRAIFERGLRYYLDGGGNGCLTHYVINEAGQCQESGRDQQHTQLGLALLAACSETAWHQGLDLYGAADNRLLKGFEYTARYNLGEEVPFVETLDRTGKYHHKLISDRGRGHLRAVYEMVYNHYVNRMGLAAPYTRRAAEKIRPEGPGQPSADHPGFGTLLFFRRLEQRDTMTAPTASGGLLGRGRTDCIELSWTAGVHAESYTVKRRVNPEESFEVIARGLTSPAYMDESVTRGQVYTYTVCASNALGTGEDALPTRVCAGLPEGWTHQDIGDVGVPGHSEFDGSQFTLEGSGLSLGQGTQDQMQAAYCTLKGNGTLTARYVPQLTSQFTQLGLILRDGMTPEAAGATLWVAPNLHDRNPEAPAWQAALSARRQPGLKSETVGALGLDDLFVSHGRLLNHCWLRIERKDDTVAGYASTDGKQWIEIGRLSISISRDLQVGLAVCSGLKNVTTVVKFDHVKEGSTKGEMP